MGRTTYSQVCCRAFAQVPRAQGADCLILVLPWAQSHSGTYNLTPSGYAPSGETDQPGPDPGIYDGENEHNGGIGK